MLKGMADNIKCPNNDCKQTADQRIVAILTSRELFEKNVEKDSDDQVSLSTMISLVLMDLFSAGSDCQRVRLDENLNFKFLKIILFSDIKLNFNLMLIVLCVLTRQLQRLNLNYNKIIHKIILLKH